MTDFYLRDDMGDGDEETGEDMDTGSAEEES